MSRLEADSIMEKRLEGRRTMAEGFGKNEKTKYRLAQAVKECMKTTPVDKITVKADLLPEFSGQIRPD